MKDFRRQVNLISALLILSLIVFGCTRRKSGESAKGRITLRYENWEVLPSQIALHQQIVRQFNRTHRDIQVIFQPVYGGGQKILTEIAGGAAPDIFYWDSDGLPAIASKKAVVDLSFLVKKDKAKGRFDPGDYFSIAWDCVSYDGGIWGMPIYCGPSALIYNKELFKRANLLYPNESWTMEDFLKAAQKLTLQEKGKTIQFGTVGIRHQVMIRNLGGEFFNQDFSKCLLDSPESKKALQFLHDLLWRYHVFPTPTQSASFGGGVQSDMDLFMTGRVGMVIAPSFYLANLNKINNFEWDIAPLPRGKNGNRKSYMGVGALCISTQSRHPDEAWEFIKYVGSREAQDTFAKGRNNIPSLKKSAYGVFCTPPPEHMKYFVDSITYSYPPPKVSWFPEFVSKVFSPQYELLMLNKQTVEETVRNITAEAKDYCRQSTTGGSH